MIHIKPPPLDDFPKPHPGPARRKEEAKLAVRIARKSGSAVVKLVMLNMREALQYAWRVCNQRIPGDELVSICYRELTAGAFRYTQPERTRFFAFMKAGIRGSLKTYWNHQNTVKNGGSQVPIEDLEEAEQKLTTREMGLVRHASAPDFTLPEWDQLFLSEKITGLNEVMRRVLSDHERMVLDLYFKTGLTFKQIGALLDVSKAAAHVVCRDALKKLRVFFQDNPQFAKHFTQ